MPGAVSLSAPVRTARGSSVSADGIPGGPRRRRRRRHQHEPCRRIRRQAVHRRRRRRHPCRTGRRRPDATATVGYRRRRHLGSRRRAALPLPASRAALGGRPSRRRGADRTLRRRRPGARRRRVGVAGSAHDLAGRCAGTVVCAISPWGTTGPYADRPASELTVQAESGAVALRGVAAFPPFQMGGSIVEWVGGAYGAVASLAAIRRARSTGHGELIDVSLAEVANLTGTVFTDLFHSLAGRPPVAPGVAWRSMEIPSIEPTLDGWVGFNTNTRAQWEAFCLLIEQPDLIADGEFASLSVRLARAEEWNAMVRAWTTRHRTADIVELAAALRIPVAPVADGPGVLGLDHAIARGVFVDDPTGSFRVPRRPWTIDAEPAPAPGPAPAVGEHTAAPVPQRRDRPEPTAVGARAATARRHHRARPHGMVGRAIGRRPVGRAGRRRHPRRVDPADRRHAHRRRCLRLAWRLVGVQRVLPADQHQQARHHPGSRTSRRAGAGPRARRSRRRGHRELHSSGARVVRSRLARHPCRQPGGDHGAHAGLRARRPVAGPPRLRPDHGAGHRPGLDDRSPRGPAAHPARPLRPQRWAPRGLRHPGGARTARPHRRRLPGRGPDVRSRAGGRRRTRARVVGPRRHRRADGQSQPRRCTPEPVSDGRARAMARAVVRHRRPLGGARRRHRPPRPRRRSGTAATSPGAAATTTASTRPSRRGAAPAASTRPSPSWSPPGSPPGPPPTPAAAPIIPR
jgi:crotonobetainyl-CoA:carnitine CoA-transferase CaiB-like acyl-CoA transferase